MRIVLFHTALPQPGVKPGGVELVVHRLAEVLAEDERDTVTVVSVTPAPPLATYAHRRLFPRATWLHESKPARWLLLPVLLNLVRWPDADVVHLHGDDWFLVRRPWATVRTFHGSALRESQSGTSLKRRAYVFVHPLERLARRLATLSCATDEDTKRLLGAQHVVALGVDVQRFEPGPKAEHPTTLFVGTWHGRKRGHLVYESFVRDVLPRCPDAQLWMVTDVAPPEHPSVRHFAAPDDAEVADLYRQAWVFAYPSVYEGFGLTYLEAMASGTAVVATPSAATDRFLGDGCGRVVAEAELGPSIADLLQDRAAREAIEIAGRERANGYAMPAVAREYRARFAEAIELRGRRARGQDRR